VRLRALVPLVLAACATAPTGPSPEWLARTADEEAVERLGAQLDTKYGRRYVVVADAEVRAAAFLPDDAIRAAPQDATPPLHRYVFRPADRGDRLYRMTYVAEGGVVVGRKFLEDLELESTIGDEGRAVLRRRGGAGGLPVTAPSRVALVLTSLDGAHVERVSAVYDPDFDGGLLVPPSLARRFALQLFEIPGSAEVQVALGRPFRAQRANLLARVEALGVAGPVEVLTEALEVSR
jgi:hypothetical protein